MTPRCSSTSSPSRRRWASRSRACIRWRRVSTLSGRAEGRLVLGLLLRGRAQVLLLDEPDSFLDVPGKVWLEQQLRETPKTVLLISHDRELLSQSASHVVSVELGVVGNTVWLHGRRFAVHEASAERSPVSRSSDAAGTRSTRSSGRWCCRSGSRRSTTTELRRGTRRRRRGCKFEEAGPPIAVPRQQTVRMRLTGGRIAKRAVVCEFPRVDRADAAVRRRGVVRRAGGGSGRQRMGKSHLLNCWPRAGPIRMSSTSRSAT